jgi:uncharacterized protein YbaR (Trm112 family)
VKKAKAILSWQLWIECPKCKADIDLSDQDEDGWVSTPIFNNKWGDLLDEEVICPDCDYEFQIEDVEY